MEIVHFIYDINSTIFLASISSGLNSIDWKNGITGAILGAVLSYNFPLLVTFIKNILRDKYKTYYGEYFIYNWAVSNTKEISEKKLVISRNLFSFPVVAIIIKEHVSLNYKGKMRTNGKSLYFDLFGKEHEEELKIVFHEPLEKKIYLLIGVFSAITLDSDPFSGKVLISNNRLSMDNVKKYLGSRNLIIVDSKHQRNELLHTKVSTENIINRNI